MKRLILIFTIVILFIAGLNIQPAKASGAYFYLSPPSGTYYIGQPFTVNIMVATDGENTDAADVYLNYNPNYLEVVDALPAIPGTQIQPGPIYSVYPGNEVNAATGFIRVTGFNPMTPYNSGKGSGVFATITFKGKQITNGTTVSFEFNPGDSHDCNLAQTITSADILTAATGGVYRIAPDTIGPYITNLSPAAGATGVSPNTNVSFRIKDDQTAVDINSVKVVLNGVEYTVNGANRFKYSGNPKDYYIIIDSLTFNYLQVVPLHIEGADIWGNLTKLDTSFTTAPRPVNLPPTFKNIIEKYIYAGETLTFPVIATDLNSGDRLTITSTNLPSGASLIEVGNGSSLFTWTTTMSDLGDYRVNFKVVDNGVPVLSDDLTVIIHVIERIIPPPVPPDDCPVCPPCGQRTACSDNRDNDGDQKIDLEDPACVDYYDTDELVFGGKRSTIKQLVKDFKISYQNSRTSDLINNKVFKIASPDGRATLSLSPAVGNFYPGQAVNVNILVNTDHVPTDAVDVILSYDPNYLEVQDALPSVAGIQIQPGTIYEAYPGNIVDPVKGEIKLTAFSIIGEYNSGSGAGVLATINFIAKQIVNGTLVKFYYIPGSTTDCNVAISGTSQDILTGVLNGNYNIIPDARPPYITNFTPPYKSIGRSPSSNISFQLHDDETAVDINSVSVRVEDTKYTATVNPKFSYSGISKLYTIIIDPPNFDYEQVVDVYVEAADTQGNFMTYYSWFQIMSMPINKPPVLQTIADQTAYTGTNLSFIVSASDPDTADILTYTLINPPMGATLTKLNNNQAIFEWLVPITSIGSYYPTIRVEDNGDPRLSDEQIVTITIKKTEVAQPEVTKCQPCPVCPACLDNFDNDGDGATDYPNDPGCLSPEDEDETDPAISPICFDGLDNDGDGLFDFPNDPGCDSAADDDETNPSILPVCSDRLDNDDDGYVDYPADPGCDSAADDDEIDVLPPEIIPECSDGLDNDGDGLIDYPNDPDCLTPVDDQESFTVEPTTISRIIDQITEKVLATVGKINNFIKKAVDKFFENKKVEQFAKNIGVPVLAFFALWNLLWLLAFLARRLMRLTGVVYDEITKKRVTLALTKVFRSQDDALVAECLTDAQGFFGFKLSEGEYYLRVEKNNYVFPSLALFGQKTDGEYDKLYFGELIKLDEEHKKVFISIPIKPQEGESKAIGKEVWVSIFRRFIYFIAFLAIVVALVFMLVYPSKLMFAILMAHVILYFLLRYFIRVKKTCR